MKKFLHCLALLGLLAAAPILAQEKDPPANDEAGIKKAVADYVAAFNKHDAKALAAHWSPDAVYTNRITGEKVAGAAAIAAQFTALFKAQPEVKLEVVTESIQFVAPSVAVEHGTAKILAPKSEPEEINYTAVYVKSGGRWLLDRVTDDAKDAKEAHVKELSKLEWMVGNWVDADENSVIETQCAWTKNRTYLTRSFSVAVDGKIEMSGMQIIGWDASAKQIRSWTFDSDGGFAEATWSQQKDRWYVHNKGVLADGRKGTMVNVIKPVDENSFTWQTIERTAGGELLPNVNEVLIVRQ
jgi:uncharacterized protein (TIGR02246 family)